MQQMSPSEALHSAYYFRFVAAFICDHDRNRNMGFDSTTSIPHLGRFLSTIQGHLSYLLDDPRAFKLSSCGVTKCEHLRCGEESSERGVPAKTVVYKRTHRRKWLGNHLKKTNAFFLGGTFRTPVQKISKFSA